MITATLPKSAVCTLTAAQRVICLVLAAALALVLGAGVATADPPDVPTPDTSNAPESLSPNSDYNVDLNAQVAAFKERIMVWQERYPALAEQAESLGERIVTHNAKVDSFPNRTAPPEIAGPINAEGAALRAEQQELVPQVDAWMEEGRALETERLRLLRQIAFILQNVYKTRPPTVQREQGGDPARQLGRNSLGKYTGGNGGDSVSRKKEDDALNAYAENHGVEVDKRQVAAHLSPDALSKLSAEEVGKLGLFRKYDGLIRMPNGHYKALEVKTAGTGLTKAQTPFDDAILRGGQATAVVDGKEIIIDEVEVVPG